MQTKCDYCGSFVDDHEEKCPYCDAVNSHFVRIMRDTPKTIAELRNWYLDRQLPPEEETRFFIGIDYQLPRAYGIYKDNKGDVILYMNKNDGTRVIRYRGSDEEYAVNDLYMRIREGLINKALQKEEEEKAKYASPIVGVVLIIGFGLGVIFPGTLCMMLPVIMIGIPIAGTVSSALRNDSEEQNKLYTKITVVITIIAILVGIVATPFLTTG